MERPCQTPVTKNTSPKMIPNRPSPKAFHVSRLLENLTCFAATRIPTAYCAPSHHYNDDQEGGDLPFDYIDAKTKPSHKNDCSQGRGRMPVYHRRHDSFLVNEKEYCSEHSQEDDRNMLVPLSSDEGGSSRSDRSASSLGSDYSSSCDVNTLGARTAQAMQQQPRTVSATSNSLPSRNTQKASNKYESIRKKFDQMRLQQKFSEGRRAQPKLGSSKVVQDSVHVRQQRNELAKHILERRVKDCNGINNSRTGSDPP